MQSYVDVNIFCEDGVVRAHQMLLATASPFLKLLFQSSPLYGVEEISIILPEVKACLVQALVHFVYTGTVVSKEDHFYSLMKLVYALNINASIEAESTNEKPTAFPPPLIPVITTDNPATAAALKRKYPMTNMISTTPGIQQMQPQGVPMNIPQQPPPQPQMQTHTVTSGGMVMPALPTQPLAVSLPTQPVPPAKMARMSNVTTQNKPMAIQLPTQPVPIAGMVNGSAGTTVATVTGGIMTQGNKQEMVQGGSYIAVDPTTGLSYKVELPNGPGGGDGSDPLAAIMNETIFTDTSGSKN